MRSMGKRFEMEERETEAVDVVLMPEDSKKRSSAVLVALGGALLFAALLVGAYLATSNDDGGGDLAAEGSTDDVVEDRDDVPPDDVESPTTTVGPDGDDDGLPVDGLPVDGPGTTTSPGGYFEGHEAADSDFYGGGASGVVFTGSQFVGLGWGESGQTLRTSPDGVLWDEKPFPGLPENANVQLLAEHEGTVVAVVEQWVANDWSDDPIEKYFGPSEGPTQFLASSTDLESWSFVELPGADQSDGRVYASVNAVAVGESGVVLMTQHYNEGANEMRILFDAGILAVDDLGRYCGINFDGPPATSTIDVQLCNFEDDEPIYAEFEEAMAAAETEAEREEVARRFDDLFVEQAPEVIASIAPGDPLHAQLSEIYDGFGEAPENKVLSGPVGGPFVQTSLTQAGYTSGLVELDGTFVAVLQQWGDEFDDRSSTSVIRSTDGVSWVAGRAVPAGNVYQLLAADSNVVAVGGDDDGNLLSFVSSDLGDSWSSTGLTTGLYGAYAQAVQGPAGVVMLIQGSTEPYPEYGPPEDVVITKDGYTLTISHAENGITNVLVGPDGNEIYSLTDEETYGDDGLVRIGRLSGTQTFLDPVTGEDLVAFTGEDFEKAYSSIEEPRFDEPEWGSETLFSADGVSWSAITDAQLDLDGRQGSIQLAAVGDDEAIFSKFTWVEPPEELFAFEEEGRDPSDAEISALDQWYESNGENEPEYIRIQLN